VKYQGLARSSLLTGFVFDLGVGVPSAVSLIAFCANVFLLFNAFTPELRTRVHLFLMYREKIQLFGRISLRDKRVTFPSIA
jgi:hypothetical protein